MSVKTKKILVFVFTAIIALTFLGTAVYAFEPGEVISGMEGQDPTGTDVLTGLGGKILSILQVAGVILGTIILVVLGLKYMMGSLEEKAEYKKTMIPFVVGAVIIIAAPTLAKGIFALIGSLGTVSK